MLSLGSKGTDVTELQRLLNAVCFKCSVDGAFGPNTQKMVVAAQKAMGLKADGVYNTETQKGLCLWAPHKALGVSISPHFKDIEFVCKDGSGLVSIHPKLPGKLEQLRAYFGGAVVQINSGFRTPSYNAKVGGAKASCHLKGMAADVVIKGHTPKEVAAAMRKLGFGGVGLYGSFTHGDVGPVRSWIG